MSVAKRKATDHAATVAFKKQKPASKKSSVPPKPLGLEESSESGDSEIETCAVAAPTPYQKNDDGKKFKLDTSSAEAHAKQRAVAKERKASKPNADIIARSKQLWERLRRKSHVPLEERKKLVTELFDIINGRVRDFVFKHDSVRVIQCALKYANTEQRQSITKELQGDIRTLAESKYGKFLVAKMITAGDQETRNMVVPEFYGHVRRLINHPEAAWIMDDIYRQVASSDQKVTLLREWYGAEFALFHRKPSANTALPASTEGTAELSDILKANPEKRKPILQYLHELINSLIQKKMTGFTMLHDAMLQYFLALVPGGEEQRAFLDEMLGDIDAETEGGGGDLYKNLAFTKSGSRLVCLALAYGTPKDRKVILRVFRDTVEMMAFDQHAKMVLVAGLDVPDDTQMTSKAIYKELLAEKIADREQRNDKLEAMVNDLNARLPLLFNVQNTTKSLFANEREKALVEEIHDIRKTTSKKVPETRRKELQQSLASPLLDFLSQRTSSLTRTSFGWQFIVESLLGLDAPQRAQAVSAVAQLASGSPKDEGHIAQDAAAGRALKTLVSGGPFDPKEKKIKLVEPRLEFGDSLWPVIKGHAVEWACSSSSFVILALLESEDVSDAVKGEVRSRLKKGVKELKAVAGQIGKDTKNEKGVGKTFKDKDKVVGNPGARMLLERLK